MRKLNLFILLSAALLLGSNSMAVSAETVPSPSESSFDNASSQEITEADYPSLLRGDLTKQDLEFVLAYGPESMTEQGLSDQDRMFTINNFCTLAESGAAHIESRGTDANYRHGFDLSGLNRYLGVLAGCQVSEDNDTDTPYGLDVDGDTVWTGLAEINMTNSAVINNAYYQDSELIIAYSFHKSVYDPPYSSETDVEKLAHLQQQPDGKYQIVKIEDGTAAPQEAAPGDSSTPDPTATVESTVTSTPEQLVAIYTDILNSISGYEFPNAQTIAGDYEYFLADLNRDGIKDLVVGPLVENGVFYNHDCRFFLAEGDSIAAIGDDLLILTASIPADKNGFFTKDFSRGTGETSQHRVTVQNGQLQIGSSEANYIMGSDEDTAFLTANPIVEWKSITVPPTLEDMNS